MKIAVILLGTLALLALVVAVVGWSLPVKHRASRSATYPATPGAVYAAITKVEDFPAWRTGIRKVEVVEPVAGGRRFREFSGDGAILFIVEEAVPPTRLVTRIADHSLPFGGSWTYELAPAATGTSLRITEDGEVYNPIFRFMSRFVFGHQATIDTYLTDLGRRFAMRPAITS